MTDLKNSKFMYLKAILFLGILFISVGLIIYETKSWRIALLLILTIWASARIYYFMFYVIEKYIDSEYKFAGIYSFIRYLLQRKKK